MAESYTEQSFPYYIRWLQDTWTLSLDDSPTWVEFGFGELAPSRRAQSSAVYDPVRDRILLFGGKGAGTHEYLNDLWEFPLSGEPAWHQLAPAGTPPAGRASHSAIYDPLRDRMVVFGGIQDATRFGDVWELSLSGTPTWTQLAPSGIAPDARMKHAAAYDLLRDRMVVFGGNLYSTLLADTWFLVWGAGGATSVGNDPPQAGFESAPAISCRPVPSRGSVSILYRTEQPGERVRVDVYDVRGRSVRRLVAGRSEAGSHSIPWDGKDDSGREVPQGIYFVALAGETGAATARLVLLR